MKKTLAPKARLPAYHKLRPVLKYRFSTINPLVNKVSVLANKMKNLKGIEKVLQKLETSAINPIPIKMPPVASKAVIGDTLFFSV